MTDLILLIGMMGALMAGVAAIETAWRCLRPALSWLRHRAAFRVSPIRLQSLSQGKSA